MNALTSTRKLNLNQIIEATEKVRQIAEAKQATVAQVILAWYFEEPGHQRGNSRGTQTGTSGKQRKGNGN